MKGESRFFIYIVIICLFALNSCEKKSDSHANLPAQSNSRITNSNAHQVKSKKAPLSLARDYYSNAKDASVIKNDLDNLLSDYDSETIIRLFEEHSLSENISDRFYCSRLLVALFRIDSDEALNLFSKSTLHTGGLGFAFLQTAMDERPDMVISWLKSQTDQTINNQALQSLSRAIGRNMPEQVVNILSTQSPSQAAKMATLIFQEFSGTFDEAKNIIASVNGDVQAASILGLAARFGKINPEECLLMMNSASSSELFRQPMADQLFRNALNSLFEKDDKKSMEFLEQFEPARLQRLLTDKQLLNSAIANDVDGAKELLNQIVPTQANAAIFTNAAYTMACKDPQKAFEWAQSLSLGETKLRSGIIERVIEIWAQNDIESAKKHCLSMTEESRVDAIRGIARAAALKRGDVEIAASSWAASLGEAGQSSFYRAATEYNCYSDPVAAAKMLTEQNISKLVDKDLTAASQLVGLNYAKMKGANPAISWAMTLADVAKPSAISGIMNHWVAEDPVAASEWLSKQPAGPARDAGAQEIINQIKDTDPETAEQWRKSMTPK